MDFAKAFDKVLHDSDMSDFLVNCSGTVVRRTYATAWVNFFT